MKKITLFLAMVLMSTFTWAQYCTGGPNSTSDSNVQQVDLTGATSTISHTGCPAVIGVEDLTAESADLIAGTQYALSVTFGTCGGNYTGKGEVWIDYNQNQVFEPSESIGQSSGRPGTAPWDAPVVFNFTPPITAQNGNTRMRIIQREAGILPLNPCSNYNWGSVMDFNIDISGAVGIPPCLAPNSLTVSNILPTSANLGWTSPDALFDVEVVAQGTVSSGIPTDTGVSNPFTKTGLLAATAYDFYVRADCGSGNTSPWSGPFTFTTAIALPVGVTCLGGNNVDVFTEEFNAKGDWTGNIISSYTEQGSWIFPKTGSTPSVNTGANGAQSGANYMYYEASGGVIATVSAVSPAIDLTTALSGAELSFYMHAFGVGIGDFEVGVGNTVTGPFATVFSWSGQLQGANGEAWQQVGVNLDAYLGQTIYLEFKYTSTGNFDGDLSIDLVKVATCSSLCASPVSLTASNVLSTSANLGWASADALFDVEVVAQGTTPSGIPTDVGVTNPFTKTGLLANTAYDFYVRTDCGLANVSTWEGPFSFATATVLAVQDLQQLEGFRFYPNPVTNVLKVSAQNAIESLQIVNMLGQVVKTAQPNLQLYSLDVSNLAVGVYFVKAKVNHIEGTFRIVKQ